MKKRWWIIGVVLAVGLLVGWITVNSQEPIPAFQLKRENVVATLTVTGEVIADTSVTFSPTISGPIVSMNVDEGDIIHPGQVLAQIDAAQAQAQLAQAQDQQTQSEAAYAFILQGTRPEEIELQNQRYQESLHRIVQAQSALASANNRMTDADRTAKRFQDLYQQELVSAQEYDNAQLQSVVAHREAERLQADLLGSQRQSRQIAAQLQQAQRGATPPERRQAAAAAQAARANTQALRSALAYYRITSNINGIITERLHDPGDSVRPGDAILRAVIPKSLQISASIEENDIEKVHRGDTAYIVLDAIPKEALPGTIIRVGNRVNPDNGTVEARVMLQPTAWSRMKGVQLMPGMTADVNIIIGHLQNALVLPASAVRNEGAGWVVYAFRDKRLVKLPVEGQRISMETFQITGGIQPGDWVATSASEKLTDKQRVRPVPAENRSANNKPPAGVGNLPGSR